MAFLDVLKMFWPREPLGAWRPHVSHRGGNLSQPEPSPQRRPDGMLRLGCSADVPQRGVAPPPQLSSPQLSSARRSSAHLSSAHLRSAHLNSAHLTSAHFASAQLTSPHLSSAQLTSPQLTSAQLESPQLNAHVPLLTPHDSVLTTQCATFISKTRFSVLNSQTVMGHFARIIIFFRFSENPRNF